MEMRLGENQGVLLEFSVGWGYLLIGRRKLVCSSPALDSYSKVQKCLELYLAVLSETKSPLNFSETLTKL